MPERLSQAVCEFARTLLSPYDLENVLDRLLKQTMAALDAASAGIMLADESGQLAFAAASDDRVKPIETTQAETGSGACCEAYSTNQVVTIADLRTDGRWPGYAERALDQGFAAVIGVPLVAWGQTIGVLNISRHTPASWTEADIDASEIVASMGAAYILGSTQSQAQHDLSQQLYAALHSRATIDQAKGIIMVTEDVDAEAAFDRLRDLSQHRNEKLRDIAAYITEHGRPPD